MFKLSMFLFFLLLISCQKRRLDSHSRDEVIIEFAARLEEQMPNYHSINDQEKKLPVKKTKK